MRATFIFLIALFIVLTDAGEVTVEDTNSPLVSYLLAKFQQLESKTKQQDHQRGYTKVY